MSQPAQFPRRHHSCATLCGRTQSGRRGLGAQHYAKGIGGLECEGYRLFPRERADARWRQRRGLDGARDQEHLAIVGRRSRGDSGIRQIAAAGRGAAATEEEGARSMIGKSGYRFSSRQTRSVCAESCSNKKIERDDDSKKSHHALAATSPEQGLRSDAPSRSDSGGHSYLLWSYLRANLYWLFLRRAGRDRRLFLRHVCGRFCAFRIEDTSGLVHVGECAIELAHLIEDDAAIEIGLRESRIMLDRQIEICERTVDVAIAIGEHASFAIGFGMVRRGAGFGVGPARGDLAERDGRNG